MKTRNHGLLATVVAAAVSFSVPAIAQQPQPGSIHGHVQNPAGQAIANAKIELTKDRTVPEKDEKMVYTFDTDANGDYKGDGIAPGEYFAYVNQGGKHVDRLDLAIKSGESKTLDFDMTREEYMKSLTPEERKTIEEYRAKNAAASSANKVIANLNNTLKAVRADLAEKASSHGDVSSDVSQMKQAVDSKPDEGLLWVVYGDTLQAQGDHMAADLRAAHKPVSGDADTVKEYTDAGDAYKKGSDLMAASKKPNPADQAIAYNQMGNAFAKAGKGDDAKSAFENAAKLDPTKAGMYYSNEAAILFNASQTNDALAPAAADAADKAIQADPSRPDPYFIKASALAKKITISPQGKVIAPPGMVEACEAYLGLAPTGPHAGDMKALLQGAGETIKTSYKAPRGR